MWKIFILACLLAIASCASPPEYPKNSFFTVRTDPDGVWWFVDPNNQTFWSKGIDTWSPRGEIDKTTRVSEYSNTIAQKYNGSIAKWTDDQVERAMRWGINTFGSWVNGVLFNKKMPYVQIIGFYAEWREYTNTRDSISAVVPDLYDPEFADFSRNLVREKVLPYINDQYLMGWILDNEVHLGTNWWRGITIFADYVNRTKDSFAYKAALAYTQNLFPNNNIAKLNKDWNLNITSWDEFNLIKFTNTNSFMYYSVRFDQQTARQYFTVTTTILRAADPNHLVLGVKWNGAPNSMAVGVETSDVISIDLYRVPKVEHPEFLQIFKVSAKPVLVGEFNFKGNDTGHPNTRGGGIRVDNQTVRAE